MNSFNRFANNWGRVWGQLNSQQKIMFISAPAVLFLCMMIAVYYASRPQWVTIVTGADSAQIEQMRKHLETVNISFELGTNSISVQNKDKAKATVSLAGAGLLDKNFGPGLELFDQVRLGMTDRMFDTQLIRALQNTLAKTIVDGSRNIQNAYVQITAPKDALFKEDQSKPTASVKVISRGELTKEDVLGIQNLVAFAVDKLEPSRVAVMNKDNQVLSEDTEIDSDAKVASKRLEVERQVANNLRQKLVQQLDKLVGPNNYEVSINVKMDWTEEATRGVKLEVDSPAPVSEKTYEENSQTKGIAGPPGPSSNVQDSGIGLESERDKTTITESLTNTQYPWTEMTSKKSPGMLTEVGATVTLNYVDVNGKKDKYDQARLDEIKKVLTGAIQLPSTPVNVTVAQLPYDDSLSKQIARAQMWDTAGNAVKSMIPLLLLLALAYFAYTFFQKAFAPKDADLEMVEEEIPIEPVTEARELSLSQLGLSEFGDVASLPAEEQRRLKMQEHVINYASEKPDEVAAIIKAWLSG